MREKQTTICSTPDCEASSVIWLLTICSRPGATSLVSGTTATTDPATAFDPFARGAAAAHNLRLPGIFITTNRNAVTDLTLEDAKFYGDLIKLPGGPISFR